MKKTTLLIMLLMSLFGYSQEITVSIDVSADPGGVNIVSPSVSGNWAEYPATVDPNNANIYSYTFAEGVTLSLIHI